MRSLAVIGWCLCGLATARAGSAWAEPTIHPVGVTIYDRTVAQNEFVLFSGADNQTHLIDMNGNEVHRWPQRGFPALFIDPALIGGQTGHILVQTSQTDKIATSALPGAPALFGDRTVGEVDWSGKVVWDWGDGQPGGAARQHHDLRRLPNGNTLILYNSAHPIAGFKAKKLLDDAVEEVTRDGKIAWKWQFSDHLGELGFTPSEFNLLQIAGQPDYLHINDAAPLGPNKWFDAGDKRFAPGNIMLDSRNANFIIIVDHTTGQVVWRIGPDYPALDWHHQPVPRPVDQISGQHDAHLIETGLPGAGDLLVFDNQGAAGYPQAKLDVEAGSRILEINPLTKQIVWQYRGENSGSPGWTFHSPFISDARRLPNGNTLIDEGINGRFFQVTRSGRIVWEYISPYIGPFGPEGGIKSNWVYRAQPVPYTWAPAGTPHAEKPLQASRG